MILPRPDQVTVHALPCHAALETAPASVYLCRDVETVIRADTSIETGLSMVKTEGLVCDHKMDAGPDPPASIDLILRCAPRVGELCRSRRSGRQPSILADWA